MKNVRNKTVFLSKKIATFSVAIGLAGLILCYQNCAGNFQSAGSQSLSASSIQGPLLADTPSKYPDGSRRVWLHQMIQLPTFQLSTPYGADYPLALRQTYESPKRPEDGPQLMLDAGITGVQLLAGEGSGQEGQIADALTLADGTGLEVAPCFAVITTAGAVAMISNYIAAAKAHPSAAKIKVNGVDLYIISFYGARFDRLPSFWQQVRSQLKDMSLPVYLLGDIVTNISGSGSFNLDRIDPFSPSSVRSYAGLFDAVWTFDDGVDLDWAHMIAGFQSVNQLFAGGMLPAYNRESPANGGYSDAEGTAKYRRQWNYAVASQIDWNHVVSWNDVAERHAIWPSSEWSYTRADITAFYSAKLRHVSLPAMFSNSQAYVTTPQRVNIGQAGRTVEGLVLNGSNDSVSVNLQLVDGNGVNFGAAVSQIVSAGSAGAASLSLTVTAQPAKRFLRALVTTKSSSGVILQQITSAPILVYDAGIDATGFAFSRVKYNSIAARKFLPGTVTITLTGNPKTGAASAEVSEPPGTDVRFADVLQNTFLVKNMWNQTPRTATIPMPNAQPTPSGAPITTPASGFYGGRVIDSAQRIGYSDPVYVP